MTKALIILVIMLLCISMAAADPTYQAGTIVGGDDLANVHQENHEDSPVISRLEPGECFLVLSQGTTWTRIITLTGIRGDVHNTRVNILGPALGIGTITDEYATAKVFADSNVNSTCITRVEEGEQFLIIAYQGLVQITTRFGVSGYMTQNRVVTIYP